MHRFRAVMARTEQILPVVSEQVEVERRARPIARVRVRKTTRVDDATVDLASAKEDVSVERVPIGRIVDVPPQIRTEGDTTIVPVVEETVVVQKRLLLREEIRITKRRSEETRRVTVPLRRQQVDIQRELASDELERRER